MVKKISNKQILSADILNNGDIGKQIMDGIYEWAIFTYKKKKYLIERIGKCNQCGSCCKFWNLGRGYSKEYTKYVFNFLKGKRTKFGTMFDIKCKQLTKNNKCKLWKKGLPEVCKQFPHCSDGTYLLVLKKCGWKFRVIGELI